MDIAGREYKAVIYNDLEADDITWFRGEPLISLRLMLSQLKILRLLHHNIAPLILYSLFSLCHYIFENPSGYSTDLTYLIGGKACACIRGLF
jgi:hypothetical protein